MNALSISNLSFSYPNSQEILSGITLELTAGESLGIIGPNGGGKSTFLKLITGLLKNFSGDIKIFDQNIVDTYPRSLVSLVPQVSELHTEINLSVEEFIELGGLIYGKLQKSEVIAMVGLTGKEKKLVSHLSGGEKQRALLARALITCPKILVLDEPTTGLDSNGQDQLLEILKEIKNKYQTSVLMVDHNINNTIRHCDKIICINRNAHWHDHKDLLTNDILSSIYHCEFEHLLIHEHVGATDHHDHTECQHDDHSKHLHKTIKPKFSLRPNSKSRNS